MTERVYLTTEQQRQIMDQAQADWALREREFPKFVRQRWDQGTPLARKQAVLDAAAKLGLL